MAATLSWAQQLGHAARQRALAEFDERIVISRTLDDTELTLQLPCLCHNRTPGPSSGLPMNSTPAASKDPWIIASVRE